MKICSFNINGLRARLHQLAVVAQSYDLIGLQEIKVADAQYPAADVAALGLISEHHGQKGHYGVANLARMPALAVQKGFAWRSPQAQTRLLASRYATSLGRDLLLVNGYFPQGENRRHETKFPAKAEFYADLYQFLAEQPADALYAVIGDMNVAICDQDIGIGEVNRKRWLSQGKCAFLPEERLWFQRLLDLGLTDSFRHCQPEAHALSWFDYRSRAFEDDPKRGLRIDYILLSPALLPYLQSVGIDLGVRAMEKPSDHAPVWCELDFSLV